MKKHQKQKISIYIPLYHNDTKLHTKQRDEEKGMVDEDIYMRTMQTSPECYICCFQFMLTKSFERHIQQMHLLDLSNLDGPCAFCDAAFSSPKAILRHLQTVHQLDKTNTIRDHARQRFHLLNRQKMVSKQDTFYCRDCQLSFTNKGQFRFHLKEKHRRLIPIKKRELRQIDSQQFSIDVVEERDVIEQFLNESQSNPKRVQVSAFKRPTIC